MPKISTKYFLCETKPRKICLLRKPVQTKAVPRFESMEPKINFHTQKSEIKSRSNLHTDIENAVGWTNVIIVQCFEMGTK